MNPDQYCEDKAARSGSSFYYSFRLLSPTPRHALVALYALCREVDDVVDEVHEESVARAKLTWWREEIARMYQGAAQHPVTRALMPHLAQYSLPHALFNDILDGMDMDLMQARYASFADLERYCYHVAGAVGLLSARIFGYRDAGTLAYAQQLGTALQLTNIIRDVGEDARRGRIYLPVDELARFNVPAADVLAYRETDAFNQLMLFQIERAESFYQHALAALPTVDRKTQRVGLAMAAIYRATLAEIRRDGPAKVLNQRLSLTPLRKLWLAWKAWVFV